MTRRFIIGLARFIFWVISRLKFTGLENIPLDRPAILTGNHIGMLDGFLVPTIPRVINHPNLIVIVAEKWQDSVFFSWAVKHLGFTFIDRFNADGATLKKVLRSLKNNGLLVIAPEGTRSKTASLIEGKPGTAYLAARTGATIVPFGATGTEDQVVLPKLKKFKKLDITVTIGEPYTIPELPREGRDEFLKEYTDEIMCQIAALLPPEYRGAYADHPRLQELLQASRTGHSIK
ncbi:MAG: lysophospholipid acyltransferase family protein [Anaerolineales bacterium]